MSFQSAKFYPVNRSNVHYSQARRQDFAAGSEKSQGGEHF